MKLKPMIDKKQWSKKGILNYEVIPTSFSDYNIHIIYCKDLLSARNHPAIVGVLGNELYESYTVGLCCYDVGINSIFIFIQDPAYVSVIAHECFHAARALLQVMFRLPLSQETTSHF